MGCHCLLLKSPKTGAGQGDGGGRGKEMEAAGLEGRKAFQLLPLARAALWLRWEFLFGGLSSFE